MRALVPNFILRTTPVNNSPVRLTICDCQYICNRRFLSQFYGTYML